MDLFVSDDNDPDYYVEYESGDDARDWSSGDEVQYNHELEDSTESFENEMNKIKETFERRRSLNNDEDFEMQDKMYVGLEDGTVNKEQNRTGHDAQEPSNDDLLYDPSVDDDNENWMQKERDKYIPSKTNKSQASKEFSSKENTPGGSNMPDGNIRSDAILNCPACMVTVCIDCQRHEIYKTQYRAMFVMHCKVDRSELLRYEKKHRGKKKKMQDCAGRLVPAECDGNGDTDIELFNPVKCTECGTVLAVYDSDEVYHFFNILASQA